MNEEKQYLGDSVYARQEGNMLVLTTENGYRDDPRNKIYLDPRVLSALFDYVNRLDLEARVVGRN